MKKESLAETSGAPVQRCADVDVSAAMELERDRARDELIAWLGAAPLTDLEREEIRREQLGHPV